MRKHTSIQTRIRYSEADQMGFVYYAHYMVFMEMGRTEWLRKKGLSYREMENLGYMLPVLSLNCRYHKAAQYDDLIEIHTKASHFSKRKIIFSYQITRNKELLFEGETTHLFMRLGKACSIDKETFASLKEGHSED